MKSLEKMVRNQLNLDISYFTQGDGYLKKTTSRTSLWHRTVNGLVPRPYVLSFKIRHGLYR